MKNIILTILTIYSITSCKSHEENLKERTINYYSDIAFKLNYELKIIEIKTIEIKECSINALDSVILLKKHKNLIKEIEHLNKNIAIAKKQNKIIKLISEQKNISKQLINSEQKKIDIILDETDLIRDEVFKQLKEDSTFLSKMTKRKKVPNDYHKYKFILKATLQNEENKHNILDTMTSYFNKNLDLIPKYTTKLK